MTQNVAIWCDLFFFNSSRICLWLDVWGYEVAPLIVWGKITQEVSVELANKLREACLFLSECEHATFVDNCFCISKDLSRRDRALIFELKVRLLGGNNFAHLWSFKCLDSDLKGFSLFRCLRCCLIIKSCLSIDNEWEQLWCKFIVRSHV